MKRQYPAIDVAKFIFSILVVAIHTVPLGNNDYGFPLNLLGSLSRLAVPFFFMASGFFLSKKFDGDFYSERNIIAVKKYALHILFLYGLWTLIYLPITIGDYIQNSYTAKKIIFNFVYGLVITGQHYNSWILWYLLSTFYAACALLFFIKVKVPKPVIGIVFLLCIPLASTITFIVDIGDGLNYFWNKAAKVLRIIPGEGRIFSGGGTFV